MLIQKRKIFKWLPLGIFSVTILFFSYRMMLLSVPYIQMKADVDFLRTKYNVYHIDYWRIGFYAHVFTSVFIMLVGAVQFNRFFIVKYPRVHRWAGYTYVWLLLFVSGPGAFAMALHANGGLPAQASFVLQTIMWYYFTIAGWYYAYKKNYTEHGAFMVRSYALTLAAISLRIMVLWLGWYKIEGLRPRDAYITVAWMSWVPNMIMAELLIRVGLVKWIYKK